MSVQNIAKKYTIEIDGQEAMRGMSSLKAETRELNQYLDTIPGGSKEATAALQRLANLKDEMGDLRGVIDTLNPDGKIQAFLQLGEAATGAFTVATVAAESFGLSSGAVEKYQERIMGLIGVMQGLEQIRNVLEPQNIAAIKNLFGLATATKSVSDANVVATGTSKALRVALATIGIGLLIAAVGILITNFDKVKKTMSEWFPILNGAGKLVDKVTESIWGIGAAAKQVFGNIGKVIKLAMQGDFSEAFEAAKSIGSGVGAAYNQGVQEKIQADAQVNFKNQLAQIIENNKRLVNEQEALGKDTYRLRLKIARDELKLMEQNSEEEIKLFKDKQSEITTIINVEAKRRNDEAKKRFDEYYKNRQDELSKMSALEIVTIQDKIKQEIEAEARGRAKRLEDFKKQMPYEVKELAAKANEEAKKLPKPSFKDTIIARLMGLDPEAYVGVKGEVEKAITDIAQGIQSVAAVFLDGAILNTDLAIAGVDNTISQIQERIAALDQEINDRVSASDSLEKQLDESRGARRDGIIKRISEEKQAEQALRAEKAKAAAEEKKAEAEKEKLILKRQKLERESIALTAAGSLATNAATAVDAVAAAVKAIKAGSGVPFPGNLIAIGTAVAAVAAAVVSAKQLATSFKSTKLANGGIIDGGSHDSGNDVPIFGGRFRVEGGEMITNKWATANNNEALDKINRFGASIRFKAVPMGRFANGGVLPDPSGTGPGSPLGPGAITELARIAENTAAIAQFTKIEAMKPARAYNAQDAKEIKNIQEQESKDEGLARL